MDKAILITGSAGAGKTTVADFIVDFHSTAMIIPMAGKLKEIARRMGWDGEKDDRGRTLLQRLGTDVGREYDKDMWVNFVIEHWVKIKRVFDHDVLISDDVRYLNEYTRVCEHFGAENVYVIRVEREDSGLGGQQADHVSEKSYQDIPYDVLIVNNGSLGDLEAEVISYVSAILKGDFEMTDHIEKAYEYAPVVLEKWRRLQADIAHSMLYNQQVLGLDFMNKVPARHQVGVTTTDMVTENIEFLTQIAMDGDKDCPLPILDRFVDLTEQTEALMIIPPLSGDMGGRVEAVVTLSSLDPENASETYIGAEDAIFTMMQYAVKDIFAAGEMKFVPMPQPEFFYPDGKDLNAPGELITCEDCESAECLFNDDNADNPKIWVCLAQEIARDRGEDAQDYQIEMEGFGDGFRLVHEVTYCGGHTDRTVIVSAHTAEEFHSEMVRLLVGDTDEEEGEEVELPEWLEEFKS